MKAKPTRAQMKEDYGTDEAFEWQGFTEI